MTLNCRSLRGKVTELKVLLDNQKVNIALLQETWLTTGDLSVYAELKENGFRVVKLERSDKRGGGLAILIKQDITKNVIPCHEFEYEDFENCCCFITIGKTKISIVNIYRPPNKSKPRFLIQFEKFLSSLLEREGMLVMAGDFNIDLSVDDNTKRDFSSILEKYGLIQLITRPTRKSSLLDFVIIQEIDESITRVIQTKEDFPSDHVPLFVTQDINSLFGTKNVKTGIVRDYQLLDDEVLKHELLQSLLTDASYFRHLNSLQCVNLYNSEITTIIDRLCPEKLRVFKRDQTKRWFTDDLRSLKQKKRQLERKMKKSPTSEKIAEEYRKAKNFYTLSLKRARINFFSQKIKSCANDSKNLYKVLNGLTGHKKDIILPNGDSESITAEKMSDFYVEKVSKIRKIIQDSGTPIKTTNNNSIDSTGHKNTSLLKFKHMTMNELKTLVSSLKKKSSKLDPVPTTILMKVIDILYPFILHMVNSAISECSFPPPLKHALVTPILKNSSLDPNKFNNFRPVSLLPFLSKILEKILYGQLNDYIEGNNLHAKMQSAYRGNHSCESALTRIVDDVQKQNSQGKHVLMILLDSSAAFDTVDHDVLLNKLQQSYNVDGEALEMLKSYLSQRSFSTVIGQAVSTVRTLKYGVPQGSLLGPLLYILYTKELEDIVLHHNMKSHMYADDCQLYVAVSTEDVTTSVNAVEVCLNDIKDWMSRNFLKLNPEKTQAKVFKCKSTNNPDLSSLPLQLSETVTILGVDLNDSFKFTKLVSKKVRKCQFHLRNFFNIKDNLNRPTRTILITNQILSTLDYCNVLLLDATDKDIYPLKLILNNAIRFIFGLRLRDHVSPYYRMMNLLPIRKRISFKACTIAHKIFYDSAPFYLRENFEKFQRTTTIGLRETSGRDDFMFSVDKKDLNSKNLLHKIKLLWNTLPNNIRKCESLPLFKSKLKTKLLSEP